ncbi:hypothetical protein DFH09DRAFT_1326672 [Mycena vulgaris]|nr:hypothetical protein DFH09DRAFT_1326672 [Mycena vulgaris]
MRNNRPNTCSAKGGAGLRSSGPTTILAGETVTVVHDVSALFDFCTTASRKCFIDARCSPRELRLTSPRAGSPTLCTEPIVLGRVASSRVTSILNAVANESGSRTLSCVDSFGVCDGNVITYTVISTTNIYFCSIFFNEGASTSLCSGTSVASRNIQGGTTLHELTHAVGNTDDIVYGCASDQALSNANSSSLQTISMQVPAHGLDGLSILLPAVLRHASITAACSGARLGRDHSQARRAQAFD